MELKELEQINNVLKNHGVIAFPTETVMGFGVIYNDLVAFKKLTEIKRRPDNKPYTLMLSKKEDIKKYAYVNEDALKVINKFMPGPLTILLNAKEELPEHVTLGTNIIGIRIPDYDIPLNIINYAKEPLLVPSANRSGMPPKMDSDSVKEEFKDELGYVVNGKALNGVASTIVDFTKSEFKILREGPISLEDIRKCLGE